VATSSANEFPPNQEKIMRSFWLASTALLITAGVAAAQTSQATPAPTGAVTSPKVTPPGVSSGNMAPTPGTTMSMSKPGAGAPAPDGAVSAPAPDGAVSAPTMTAAAPGPASGRMAPAASKTAATGTTHPWHHHWSNGPMTSGKLPEDASATTYLHIAKTAIGDHNLSLADDALSHAETRLLDRAVPQGQIAGNYAKASADTRQASSALSGM
jgi:hypothetical protein